MVLPSFPFEYVSFRLVGPVSPVPRVPTRDFRSSPIPSWHVLVWGSHAGLVRCDMTNEFDCSHFRENRCFSIHLRPLEYKSRHPSRWRFSLIYWWSRSKRIRPDTHANWRTRPVFACNVSIIIWSHRYPGYHRLWRVAIDTLEILSKEDSSLLVPWRMLHGHENG